MKYYQLAFLLLICDFTFAQVVVEGYVFETANRGYLRQAKVSCFQNGNSDPLTSVFTDSTGYFKLDLSTTGNYRIEVKKNNFKIQELPVQASEPKTFLKVELEREPGYQFEATLAPVRSSEDIVVDAIKGARIEVFNNTKDEQILELRDHPDPQFDFTLRQGNHYTVMIRKKGYLTKRIEAYVDVKDCILCLDGVGEVQPGVSDNLHEGNELGVLLANIELEPVKVGSEFDVENIYYDFDKSYIRQDAAAELDNLAIILRDNPKLIVELGSHTDSRGKDDYNMRLSDERATSAVNYLIQKGVDPDRISAKGYGESEIRNRCVNGVECDEEEHQDNRRTQITVTGMLAIDELEQKTLAQIIREENFLEQAFGGEQIVVADGEVPVDLEKYIEDQSADLSRKEIKNLKKRASGQYSLYESLPEDFSGYSILLTNEIAVLRQLRSRVNLKDTVYEYVEGEDRYYLMGDYRKLKAAKRGLEPIASSLPSADIVFFKGGKMIKK